MGRREAQDEWIAVLRPAYDDARVRHARMRSDAYEAARLDALRRRLCGPELWFSDIDAQALAVWRETWAGAHPSGAGKWNWPKLVEQLPRRAAVLPIAIWYGNDLCGMALGHASRARLNRSRHTVTLTHVERRPEPPRVSVRGQLAELAIMAAEEYGKAVGARRLRLLNPDGNPLSHYAGLGFETVWNAGVPVFCQKELFR